MKLTATLLKEVGLDDLIQGTSVEVPSLFKNKIDLLYQHDQIMIAFMKHRYLNDYRIASRIMIVLNQLVRYYRCDVILYCFSYRFFICGEKIYLTFEKRH